MFRQHAIGMDILGDFVSAATASGTGGVPSVPQEGVDYGPLSPMQLAMLSRPLTPAEASAVADWRSAESAKVAAALASKSTPTAAPTAAAPTPRPAPSPFSPVSAPPTPKQAGGVMVKKEVSFLEKEAFGGLKVWHVALLGLGAAVVTTGVVLVAVKK